MIEETALFIELANNKKPISMPGIKKDDDLRSVINLLRLGASSVSIPTTKAASDIQIAVSIYALGTEKFIFESASIPKKGGVIGQDTTMVTIRLTSY